MAPDPDDAPEDDRRLQRLRWQCRRGMLELDHLLLGFLERGHASLDASGQAIFARLLGQQDPHLSDWFMGRAAAPDPDLRWMVARILETARAGG